MAGTTRLALVQELAARMGDYASGTVAWGALAPSTAYIADSTRYEGTNFFTMGWVTTGAAGDGRGGLTELRCTAYDGTTGQFTLGGGALPANPSAGDAYEAHLHWSRARKVAAINQAIRRLPADFWRRVVDTSVTTAANTWAYALPAGLTALEKVEIQLDTTRSGGGVLGTGASGTGFPFATLLNYGVRLGVDASGVVTRVVQFEDQPPVGRVLRLSGTGVQPTLATDADVLQAGQDDYDQRLYEYVLAYAVPALWTWGANGAPAEQSQRFLGMVKLAMEEASEIRPTLVMPQAPQRVITPATGDGSYRGQSTNDPRYLAAFHGAGT